MYFLVRLIYYPNKEIDLYSFQIANLEKKVAVHVSAIVGENGSGKSTLIELLFLAIHNIASHCEILKSPDDGMPWGIEMGVKLDLYYQIDSKVFCIKLNDFEVEISSVEISKDITEYNFKNFNDFTKADFKDFFYSIAINYSIYSLNTEHIGDWIRALFHKNDGYQTPVVINPMRDRGNININREEYLSKARLLANLLVKSESDNHLKLTSNQKATTLRFELNEQKVKNLYEDQRLAKPILWTFDQLYSDYSSESELFSVLYENLIELDRDKVKVPFKEKIEKYIIKKLFKIARTYDNYRKYINDYEGTLSGPKPVVYSTSGNIQPTFYNVPKDDKNADKNFTEFIKALKKDKSHMTFKLNQAINYLRRNPLFEDDSFKWVEIDETSLFSIPISELSERISISDGAEIINFIPPSLFNIDIFLEEVNDTSKKSRFGSLSSGEQQLIQSVQSIIYHINNLNSVFDNNTDDIKYPYINILLDEIELYFHPEFQRLFVSNLIDSIKNAQLQSINGINILFSTHSPFILSDIPVSNILRLKKGKVESSTQETFGANIHDLLANDFFLEKGFIGEFARNEINKAFNFLHKGNLSDDELKFIKNIMSITGEPLIKAQLEIQLEKCVGKKAYDNWLDSEIRRLEEQKKIRKDDSNTTK